MGQEFNSDFYNSAYRLGGWNREYFKPYKDSVYYESWCTSLSIISRYAKDTTILDIGCGPGQFANLLVDHGYKKYIGFDFSSQAIMMAKRTLPHMGDHFFVDNAFESSLYSLNAGLHVCFEVLEHVNNDLGIISKIPSGSYLIASVPNYESKGHVRTFLDLAEVYNRYGAYIDIDTMLTVQMNTFNKIFIFHGKVR